MQEHITDRAHGIDVHSGQYRTDFYEKLRVPRYESLTGQVDFVIIKRSEGSWVDPAFHEVWDVLAAPAPIRGIYHYQRSAISWLLQAENVLANLPDDCQFVCLDVEKIGNVISKTMFADAGRILRYWEQHKPRPELKVIYYLNWDVGNMMLAAMTKNYPNDKWYQDFRLWYAQYAFLKTFRKPDNNPKLPTGLPANWLFYQYDESGDSQPLERYGSPDLNVFNGPVNDLRKWLGLEEVYTPPVPIPPENGDFMYKVTIVSIEGARVRTGPGTGFASIPTGSLLPYGSVHYSNKEVVPDNADPNNLDKRWIELESGGFIATKYPGSQLVRATVETVGDVPPPDVPPDRIVVANFKVTIDGTTYGVDGVPLPKLP